MATMRAKLVVNTVKEVTDGGTKKYSESLTFNGVCKDGAYPADGTDEDNSFALWSPYVNLEIAITNPNLWGQFKPGDKFYVDFTPAK